MMAVRPDAGGFLVWYYKCPLIALCDSEHQRLRLEGIASLKVHWRNESLQAQSGPGCLAPEVELINAYLPQVFPELAALAFDLSHSYVGKTDRNLRGSCGKFESGFCGKPLSCRQKPALSGHICIGIAHS